MFKNPPSASNNFMCKVLVTYIIQSTMAFMFFKVCKTSVGEEWFDQKYVSTLQKKRKYQFLHYLVISSSSFPRTKEEFIAVMFSWKERKE